MAVLLPQRRGGDGPELYSPGVSECSVAVEPAILLGLALKSRS